MVEAPVRIFKGLLMGILYGFFLLGTVFELLAVIPVIAALNRIGGFKPCRMQWTVRILMGLWLFLLRECRLLKEKNGKGRPFEGASVIVSNHPGLFDVLFLIRDIPQMSVMVKRALAKNLPLGPIFRMAGYVLSPDFEDRSPLQCLEEAVEKIRMGYKFMVFPEATRSPKGGLGRFHPGPFVIARLAGVPVQPLFIRNEPPFLSKGDKWYYPSFKVSTLEMEFWDPMAPPRVGEEREFAKNLENRYRKALGAPPSHR